MKSLYLLILASIVAFANAQTFGSPVTISTAGVPQTVSYYGGLVTVAIQLDRSATITVNPYQDLSIGTGPTIGYSPLTTPTLDQVIGAITGLQLLTSAGAVIQSCNITTTLASTITGIINGGGQVGFLQFDPVSKWYNILYPITTTATTITVPVTLPGNYSISSAVSGANVPTFFNYARQIAANVQTVLTFPQNITVQSILSSASSLTAVYHLSNPVSVNPPGYIGITWFDLDLSSVPSTIQSTITYGYNITQLTLAGVPDPNNLVLGFFNTTSLQWVFPPGGVVNLSKQTVAVPTVHFSTWAAYSSTSSSSSGTTSSSSSSTTSSANTQYAFPALILLAIILLLL
jgi:hypothetical protein